MACQLVVRVPSVLDWQALAMVSATCNTWFRRLHDTAGSCMLHGGIRLDDALF